MHRSTVGLALVLAAAFAGCVGSLGGKPEFTLEPNRIGWNVTDTASFTLTLKPGSTEEAQTYLLDPVFAVQLLKLDTGGVAGDYETDRPEDLGFEIRVDGEGVTEHRLDASSPEAELRFRLPQELKDDAYTLELVLFQAGSVTSDAFRVNRP